MKLTALLAYYDEEADWLAATVASLAKAEVDHLVACDGAYLLYPNSLRQHRSAQEQTQAILGTAYGLGIGLSLYVPQGPYVGNEIEKRNLMFDLGRTVEADWFLIIDSDEVISSAAPDLKDQLAKVDEDVAYYRLNDGETPNYVRGLYRNSPNLRISGTHYGYENGKPLWDGHGTPAADLTSYLVLEHRMRDPESTRSKDKRSYYELRDELGVEKPMVEA